MNNNTFNSPGYHMTCTILKKGSESKTEKHLPGLKPLKVKINGTLR